MEMRGRCFYYWFKHLMSLYQHFTFSIGTSAFYLFSYLFMRKCVSLQFFNCYSVLQTCNGLAYTS